MLGGNNHWVSYWSSDTKPSGLNDKQASLGRITKSGKDYRYRAGEPYDFTVEAVDAQKRGFGTWTRNGDATNPLYTYACWDFEPLKPITKRGTKGRGTRTPQPDVELTPAGSRIAKNPTVKHRHRVYREAEACYKEACGRYWTDDRILASYLVESSPDHYHVGIIFSRHLSQPEHDEIVATIREGNRPFKNLDKDSSRARKGIGTQFRAPFCWKHGVKAQCIKWFCKDEQQLIDRGESLRPPGLRNHRRKSAFESTIKDPTDRDTLLAWAIQRYPIEPHSRHVQQRALILSLLNRKIDIDSIRHIGPLWLLHFNNQATTPDTEQQNFRTDQTDAEALFNDRLNRTLKDPDLRLGSKPSHDYLDTIDNYRITPTQLATIKRILQDSGKQHHELSSPLRNGDDSSMGRFPVSPTSPAGDDGKFRSFPDGKQHHELSSPLRNGDDSSFGRFPVPIRHSAYFLEAVFVQLEINRLKDGLDGRLRCTHQQLIEIIRRRHDVEICPRQFQRIKMRFCSLACEGRSYHHATKVELLVETLKGTPGLPSEYELAPILRP